MGDIRKGFVYKRVPHVTLKSIANNEEIDAIHAKLAGAARAAPRASSTRLAEARSGRSGRCPRELPTQTLAGRARRCRGRALPQWWEPAPRAAARRSTPPSPATPTPKLLYDQPYEDNKRVRVTGPFTVESLSPHRVLSTATRTRTARSTEQEAQRQRHGSFATHDPGQPHARPACRTPRKNERLKFDRLEPYAGAVAPRRRASTPTADGKTRRVAVSIGPEHGTVGPQQVKEAAKEAVQGVGFDLLIVCGFAFDPHVSEEAKRYGKLTVLPARMNPDLAMGDELLKKTGAGNLFMVFGEPDVEITHADGRPARRSRSRAWTSTTRPPARSAAAAPTTSPAGSSTPTTTARASSCATPTSPAPTSPTTSSSAPCAPRSTRPPGRALYSHHQPPLRPARDRQDRRQGHQPLRRRGAEGV